MVSGTTPDSYELLHLYDTIGATTYSCYICTKAVDTEENLYYDKQGNPMYFHTPASRYWNRAGVFCGSDCSFNHHMDYLDNLIKCHTCKDTGDMSPGIACTNCYRG